MSYLSKGHISTGPWKSNQKLQLSNTEHCRVRVIIIIIFLKDIYFSRNHGWKNGRFNINFLSCRVILHWNMIFQLQLFSTEPWLWGGIGKYLMHLLDLVTEFRWCFVFFGKDFFSRCLRYESTSLFILGTKPSPHCLLQSHKTTGCCFWTNTHLTKMDTFDHFVLLLAHFKE